MRILSPLEAMTPKRAMDIPPRTGLGMDWSKAETFPTKLMTMARTAAPAIT